MADQKKILYCGQGCVSAWVISKNLCLYYDFSAWAGTEHLHVLFSLLPPQQRGIFEHSTGSYRKHYIIAFLNSGSVYLGHLIGTLCNLEYCFKKTLRGVYRRVLGPGFKNLTLQTLIALKHEYLSRATKASRTFCVTKAQVRNYLQG